MTGERQPGEDVRVRFRILQGKRWSSRWGPRLPARAFLGRAWVGTGRAPLASATCRRQWLCCGCDAFNDSTQPGHLHPVSEHSAPELAELGLNWV